MAKETKVANDATKPTATVETAKQTEPAKAVPIEPTSEKLEKLKSDKKAAQTKAANLTISNDEKGAEDAFLEVYRINEEIKKEIAEIKRHEAELLKKEKEAAQVKLFDDAIAAYDNHLKVNSGKGTMDEKNEAYHAYQAKREIVVNRLLGSAPRSASNATATASNGVKGAASNDIVKMMDEGKTYDEMIASGAKDGTIRSAAWKFQYAKNADGTYTKKS